MHRLFVAIRPPPHIRQQLLNAMGGVQGARWQDDEQLHLTLRFIGEVDRHRAEDIALALGSVRLSPFSLALNGLGTFERRGQAVTVWAGVTPHEEVKLLHKKVDQAIVRTGLEPERRAFSPHITMARLGRSAGSIEHLLAAGGELTSPPFEVTEFRLYESQLTPEGAHYTIVERYPLA